MPATQAERLQLLETLEPSAGRRADHAEETAIIEYGSDAPRRSKQAIERIADAIISYGY